MTQFLILITAYLLSEYFLKEIILQIAFGAVGFIVLFEFYQKIENSSEILVSTVELSDHKIIDYNDFTKSFISLSIIAVAPQTV